MSDYVKLYDTVENGEHATQGIFTYIKNNYGTIPEWLRDSVSVNLDYYYRWSGNKIISPLMKREIDAQNVLTIEKSNEVAKIILAVCRTNWDKLYEAMIINYSPIENVDEYLTETTDTTGNTTTSGNGTQAGTDTHAKTGSDATANTGKDIMAESGTDTTENHKTSTDKLSGTDTVNDRGTDTIVNSGDDVVKTKGTHVDENVNDGGTSETVNKIYGYNSETAANDNTSKTTVIQQIRDTLNIDDTATTTHGLQTVETPDLTHSTMYGKTDTLTETVNDETNYGKTDTRTLDTKETTTYNNTDTETINLTNTNSGTEDKTGNEKHDLHRHGNVGVTTNQHMINEEIELRKKFFLESVYQDVDRFLTIPIY